MLIGDGVRLRFTPVQPVPESELSGTRWVLETLLDGETAASTLGEPAVLRLREDGTFEGSTGCRTLTGTWTPSGDGVQFPDLRPACRPVSVGGGRYLRTRDRAHVLDRTAVSQTPA